MTIIRRRKESDRGEEGLVVERRLSDGRQLGELCASNGRGEGETQGFVCFSGRWIRERSHIFSLLMVREHCCHVTRLLLTAV